MTVALGFIYMKKEFLKSQKRGNIIKYTRGNIFYESAIIEIKNIKDKYYTTIIIVVLKIILLYACKFYGDSICRS